MCCKNIRELILVTDSRSFIAAGFTIHDLIWSTLVALASTVCYPLVQERLGELQWAGNTYSRKSNFDTAKFLRSHDDGLVPIF